ncbi:MAG TPA: hypothetical protein VKG91_10650 [Roseiarcus sp.]|nr:hypothetical protein [Xanthobacteraceae bacterium]HME84983.1 hypothetical protein [Roseiarcus sp.]
MSFDERPKFGYRVGLPRAGRWVELFNGALFLKAEFPDRAAPSEPSATML